MATPAVANDVPERRPYEPPRVEDVFRLERIVLQFPSPPPPPGNPEGLPPWAPG